MDKLTFYFDRNFGKRIPGALSKLRPPFDVRWHQGEGFRGDMPDDEWLEVVGRRGWIVVTQDIKFHRIAHEIEAVRQHDVRCFYFATANQGMWEKLCVFVRSHKRLAQVATTEPSPFVYQLQKTGALKGILVQDRK